MSFISPSISGLLALVIYRILVSSKQATFTIRLASAAASAALIPEPPDDLFRLGLASILLPNSLSDQDCFRQILPINPQLRSQTRFDQEITCLNKIYKPSIQECGNLSKS